MWAGSDARGGVLAEKAATFLLRGTRQNASAGKSTPNLKETIVVVVVVVIFESVVVVVVGFVAVSGDHFSTIVKQDKFILFWQIIRLVFPSLTSTDADDSYVKSPEWNNPTHRVIPNQPTSFAQLTLTAYRQK